MLRRTKNIKLINDLLNREEFKNDISMEGQDEIDLTELIKDDNNIFLMDDKNTGGFLFHHISEGTYEAHPQFLPESRGKYAFNLAIEALKYMFEKTGCFEVYASVPKEYLNSKIMARYCGFNKIDRVERYDLKIKNTSGIYDIYLLTFNDWRKKWHQE